MTRFGIAEASPALHEQLAPRAPDLRADFVTPALQALFLGFIGGWIIGGVAVFGFGGAWWAIPGVSLILTAGLYVWRQDVYDKTLYARERIVGRDLNGDGRVGDPHGAILLNTRRPGERDRAREQAADAKARQSFIAWVEQVEATGDTSARRWEQVLGREQYQAWRAALIGGGFAQWRSGNPKDGWTLTCTADEVDDALA